MKLYVDSNRLSPYAFSAFVALKEKHLAFDIEPVDLAHGEQHASAFHAVSATQRVPTLVDGAFRLSESSAIAEYLEDTHPEPAIYPRDPRQKAKAREVQAWLRSDLMPIRVERSTEVIFLGQAAAAPLSPDARAAAGKLFGAAESWIPAGRATLFDAWCIADADLALMLQRLICGGDEVPGRLAAYAGAQWQRASVQDWLRLQRPRAA